MSLSDYVEVCLGRAKEVLTEVPDAVVTQPNLLWLERQVKNIIVHLQSLLCSLDDGWGASEMGFFSDDEFLEMIDELCVEISNLQGMIRTLRSVGMSF